MIRCTSTNVLFLTPPEEELTHNGLLLTKHLSKDVMFVRCLAVGPDSTLKQGDELIVSRRVTTYHFTVNDSKFQNTSDASVIAYKRDGVLGCTCAHVLAEMYQTEETSAGGILLTRPQHDTTTWVKVVAAGPKSGVQAGDEILIDRKPTDEPYVFDLEGKKVVTIPGERVICFRRPE